MTTIAYRDGIMAADSLIISDGMRAGFRNKIARSRTVDKPYWLGAVAGRSSYATKFASWLATVSSEDRTDFLSPPPPCEDDVAMMISPDGRIFFVDGRPILTEVIDVAFFAIGSGRPFALAAMEAGMNAEKAVEIACKFDIYSGGKICTLPLLPRETEKDQA